MQTETGTKSNTSRPEKLLDLLKRPGGISEPQVTVAEYVEFIHKALSENS
jgi:hypothetical protein